MKIPLVALFICAGIYCCYQYLGRSKDSCIVWGVFHVDASRDGSVAAALGSNGRLEFFDTVSKRNITSDRLGIVRFGLSPLGKEAVCVTEGNRLVWIDSVTGKMSGSLDLSTDLKGFPRYSPDGKTVAVAVGEGGIVETSPCKVLIIDNSTRKVLREVSCFNVSFSRCALTFTPDSRYLGIGGWNRFRLVDVNSGQAVAYLHGEFVDGYVGGWVDLITFSTDGKAALVGNENVIRRYETDSWKEGQRIQVGRYVVAVGALPTSQGFWLASQDGELLRLPKHGRPIWVRKTIGPNPYSNRLDIAASKTGEIVVSSWEGDVLYLGPRQHK